MTNAEIITSFREHLRTLPRPAATAENPDPKIVCVVDSIVSNPGILLPWQEMVKICQEEGVYSVVDAAHSIGQEMNINLEEEIVVRVVNYVTKARGIFASEESVDDRDRWVSVIRRY